MTRQELIAALAADLRAEANSLATELEEQGVELTEEEILLQLLDDVREELICELDTGPAEPEVWLEESELGLEEQTC